MDEYITACEDHLLFRYFGCVAIICTMNIHVEVLM